MILSFRFYISAAIFAITLLLVIKKPKNIGIGYSALIGAAASYALGMINFSSVIAVVMCSITRSFPVKFY